MEPPSRALMELGPGKEFSHVGLGSSELESFFVLKDRGAALVGKERIRSRISASLASSRAHSEGLVLIVSVVDTKAEWSMAGKSLSVIP
jgi:hypothetical protein